MKITTWIHPVPKEKPLPSLNTSPPKPGEWLEAYGDQYIVLLYQKDMIVILNMRNGDIGYDTSGALGNYTRIKPRDASVTILTTSED